MGKILDKLGFENPLDHRKSKKLKSAYRIFYFMKFVYRNTYILLLMKPSFYLNNEI
jgi:hypothetical protein